MCLPIIGAVVTGIGAVMSSKAEQSSLKGQAAFERRQAGIETTTAAYKADRTRDEVNRVTGSQRAGFAANGLSLSGSAADTIASSQEEGALDIAAIRWNSRLSSDNLRYKAKMNDANAAQVKKAAPLAFATPIINGIATYQSSFG